jgi:hypothetical protein
MRVFASLRSVVSALFHRSLVENEIEEELRAHIQDRANDLGRSGVPRAEAERRARIEFGGYEKYKEEIREAQGTHFLETLIQDLRYALRMSRKSPGFTGVVILTLALGIGANTAIFTMMNGLMLHTLPVRDPEQLVELLHQFPGEPAFNGFSWDAYQVMRNGNHVFSDLIVGSMNFFTFRGDAGRGRPLNRPRRRSHGLSGPSSRRKLVILEVSIRSRSGNHRQENRRQR